MRPSSLATICALGAAASGLGAQPAPDTASVRAAVTPRVRALAGCYRLTIGRWRRGTRPVGGPDWLPGRFRLDTLAYTGRLAGYFAATPPALTPDSVRGLKGLWRPATDSVALDWGNGFTGVTLALVARGRTLVGRARGHHDSHRPGEPPDPAAPVHAEPAACTIGEPRA